MDDALVVGMFEGGTELLAEFEDLLYQNLRAPTANAAGGTAPAGAQVGSGARVVTTSRSFAQGPIQQTGNPLALSLHCAEGLRLAPLVRKAVQSLPE